MSHLVVEDAYLGLHLEWAIWFITVGTNLWATGLIFIHAWYVAVDPNVT